MDNVIKVNRKIMSGAIRIEKLKKYIGKTAEITIHIKNDDEEKGNSAAGFLKKYANSSLGRLENDAWSMADTLSNLKQPI